MKLVSNFISRGSSFGSVLSMQTAFFVAAFRESTSLTNRGDVSNFGKLFTERWTALSFRCTLQICLSSNFIFVFTILYHL